MSGFTLDKTLDAICTEYDYGIVSGSVTVFVRDSIENYGRFELTLLEGILLIIEAYEDGFMVTQCTPIIDTSTIKDSLKLVQDQLGRKFGTLDKLLLAISPRFSQRYWEKIQSNLSPVLAAIDLPHLLGDDPLLAIGSSSSLSTLQLQEPTIAFLSSSSSSSTTTTTAAAAATVTATATGNIDSNIFEWLL